MPPPDRRRKPTRLHGHDYAEAGMYVVTICTQNRALLFGSVDGHAVQCNPAGCMIERWWLALPSRFAGVTLDALVVMPNHLHGIIGILGSNSGTLDPLSPGEPHRLDHEPHSLTDIVGWFKTMTTNEYIRGVKTLNWEPFNGRLWQRSFYDTMIRSDRHLDRARTYIAANPSNRINDDENPKRI